MDLKKVYRWKVIEKAGSDDDYEFEGTVIDLLEELLKLVAVYSFEGCIRIGTDFNIEQMLDNLFTRGEHMLPNCWEGIYVYLLGEA